MMILLVSFVISSLKTGWKSEVDYLFIHGCKSRNLFRNWKKLLIHFFKMNRKNVFIKAAASPLIYLLLRS
jgi:hypothetical protein